MQSRGFRLFFFLLTVLLALTSGHSGLCQAISSPEPFNNPFAFPRFDDLRAPGRMYGSESIPLSSGMFPGLFSGIPHLKAGFAYSFGKNVRYGRGIIDFLLPLDIAPATTLFGEIHGEFQDFWKEPTVSVVPAPAAGVSGYRAAPIPTQQRYDLSVGGGLRRGISADSILGVNAFFDTSKVADRWYSSGGLGLEFLSLLPGNGLLDLNFNYYGNLFSGTDFANAFRNGIGNFDIEAGYSQPLFNEALDLRLKAVGYQFDAGEKVYGWRTGVDATTRDGMFRLTYEYTSDQINDPFHSISGSVHLGFQLDNLLRGESPFAMPEPIFASPRNLSRIFHEHVKRRWSQPTQIVRRRGSPSIIFMGLKTVGRLCNIFTTNENIGAATFDVVVPYGTCQYRYILLAYQFRMSDGSTQQVTATVEKIQGQVADQAWMPAGETTVGPATMDNPAGSWTDLTFMQAHEIFVSYPYASDATITITITVPGRPDIAPLVITCTVYST